MADQTVTDPLSRRVTLHNHTWYGHILKGHAEMNGRRRETVATLQSPDAIHFSTHDSDAHLYYEAVQPDGMMIVVVADLPGGYVKTAYRTKRRKGNQEWP